MPRYLVEREFPEGLNIPMNAEGAAATRKICDNNAEFSVTWVFSYVTPDRKRTFCIYDGPSPEAIRMMCLLRAPDEQPPPDDWLLKLRRSK